MSNTLIPEGYKEDRNGRLVPEAQIKAIDLARDGLVRDLVDQALLLREQLRKFKRGAFDDIAAFVQLSAEQYGARIGGDKGNVTLFSFDGRYKVIRAIQETLQLDERLQAAKALIDECLNEWTEGSRSELRVLVNNAFRVDQDGTIKTGQVLGLRRLNIQDERWQRAMAAIGDAVMIVGSKTYVRLYERDSRGEYLPISLDVAGV
ncbi:DUF3164 family protein [Xanthomonas citri]|uniref:DUF3164 family protein n=1 Tax=Xanthomonas citri TaxID=346 RepID=UPI0001CECE35|nr:DUF3164 family protein [Xanthomonas citri]AMV00296.1 sulfate transporter [Xanthomonas citri pv. aurantifolii]AMV04612.1 sulfate transporter [Xanthomonas citri pv. aurantifolii]EFF46488.1 hypothetical protein XAUC_31360 [Xanthomonas citri pv. aurantifolii str. ICPB 10535]MCC8491347.1 DUF3164 family protein [Xanthomonas citri pv. fuscans]TBW97612.1 sulfate transporter [Xanthomonas citri pv. aurantifolii]